MVLFPASIIANRGVFALIRLLHVAQITNVLFAHLNNKTGYLAELRLVPSISAAFCPHSLNTHIDISWRVLGGVVYVPATVAVEVRGTGMFSVR